MKKYVDRGSSIEGQNKTSRDTRVPFSFPRAIDNFALPDKRARRRLGYSSVHEPVKTQALCKSTATTYNKRLNESLHGKGTIATTPLSYGLIRWNTDYQLRRAEPKTIEFCVRLGDLEPHVVSPLIRTARYAGNWTDYVLRTPQVYLLDQTVISNHHKWSNDLFISGTLTPGTTYDLGALLANQYDVFPLTTMSFGFTKLNMFFNFGMVESTGANIGRYHPNAEIGYVFPAGGYTPGDIYHVAIVYDPALGAGPGRFTLYINGVSQTTFDIPVFGETLKFIGEYDVINGITYASGQKRDIVVLNETTVRASYSSCCKIRDTMHGHQTFFHQFQGTPNTGIDLWASSPPRGTAIWDLRIWNEARSAADILANSLRRILPADSGITNLKGNWHLNDGSAVCTNKLTGLEKRYCTVHHGYPSYINSSNALNGIGVKLGEGQYIIKSIGKDDRLFGSGLAAQLANTFSDRVTDAAGAFNQTLKHRDQNSFSVMIQIMVPDAFQPELNDKSADPLTLKDLALVETRRFMNTGDLPYDSLYDGTAETDTVARRPIGHRTDPTAPYDVNQHLRAYDQTLWSIEGTQKKDQVAANTNAYTNEADRRRIPIARGVLTPAGKVAFELFKSKATVALQDPKYFRLLSASTLVVGNTYTITFVQRIQYTYNAGSQIIESDGWKMEIWLQNITAGTVAVLDSSYTEAAGTDFCTVPLVHEQNYDISIGASYVNDGWDNSIAMPRPAGGAITRHSYISGGANLRAQHGPWPVQQRFMSPYQDQPGNFVVSIFRLWVNSIQEQIINTYGKSNILDRDQSVDLLVNLEFKEITGVEIPNKSRYPDTFRLGYKGWGLGQPTRALTYKSGVAARPIYLWRQQFEGAWAYEDCLGYEPITSSAYNARQLHTRVNGILPFKSSFGQQYGALAVYDDSLAFDESVTGVFKPTFINGRGLLSEFSPGLDWRGTVVGSRTFLTSQYAIPKVFNGKYASIAGFKKWSGGNLVVYETENRGTGSLTDLKWYGIAVVYFSETYGIYQVSPVATVKLHQTEKTIGIFMVPPHPDLRVSVVEVYRTLAQETESLAFSAPLFKTNGTGIANDIAGTGDSLGIPGGNTFAESIIIEEADTNLSPVILDRNVTEFPMCAFSAALNERLYLGGDPLNPDRIYFTDPGNPERIDAFFNTILLPDSSGDAQTGMVAAFGAIYVFKPTAIWRIDDAGNNRHQVTKVSYVGAVSSKSIQLITNADTGRNLIFFWSMHGPYLHDGANPAYIGSPIEESKFPGFTLPEYNWLNPSTVVVAHNVASREIICYYTPRRTDSAGVTTELDRNGEAVVFNYRTSSWYHYTGTICTNALSVIFSNSIVSKDAVTNSLQTFTYKLFLGGANGKIYLWGNDKQDGVPTGLVLTQGYTVAGSSVYPRVDFTVIPFTHELVGTWLTVIHTDGNWVTMPIDRTDTSAGINQVFCNTLWLNGFTFQTGDIAYLCRAPAKIEFPWDELDQPLYDKDVVELITWHSKVFKYRYNNNYITDPLSLVTAWTTILDGLSMRKKTQIKRKLESIKLELMSLELDASLDAFAYLVDYVEGSNTNQ